MKPIHVASVAAALVLAACAGSQKDLTGPQKAAEDAQEKAQKAQEQAEKAHDEAMAAQKDLAQSEQADEEARQAQIAADKKADLAAVQAENAERQANMAAPRPQQHAAGQAGQKGVAEAQGAPPAPKVIVITAGLLFPTGSAELSPAAKPKLAEVAGALQAQPQANNVTVTGYTDDVGNSKGNLKLSEQRAHAVADYLASQGIPKERITTKGLGMKNPIGTESTADDRAMNRRVDIDIKAVAPSSGQASPQKTP